MEAVPYGSGALPLTNSSSPSGQPQGAVSPLHPTTTNATTTTTAAAVEMYRHLLEPAPTSFTLIAAIHLLKAFSAGQTVYLMDRAYVENWLQWAIHQPVPEAEESRVIEAIRLAALQLGLAPPSTATITSTTTTTTTTSHTTITFTEPGPIDNTSLSVTGHPLLLNPWVQVMKPLQSDKFESRQLKPVHDKLSQSLNKMDKSESTAAAKIDCLAVPELFYETIRTVHGVMCDDGYTVSFQPSEMSSERLLLHHQHHHRTSTDLPTPIEFRRKVVLRPEVIQHVEPTTLMERLMLEERQIHQPVYLPVVEVHPFKLVYSIVNEKSKSVGGRGSEKRSQHGFVLVSRETSALEALMAIMRVVEPNKASQSVRLWSKRAYDGSSSSTTSSTRPTRNGDGFELVDMEYLKTKKDTKNDRESNYITLQEWQGQHQAEEVVNELELLVEVRKTVNSDWPREALELQNRVCVGDVVDAQDVAGNWYEAVIRNVEEHVLTVHYAGWASKWNTKVKRRDDSPRLDGVSSKIRPIAPLWSRTRRWRERVKVGDIVEIRDSSSLALRPKWYRGEIKKIGRKDDPIRELEGGAELEVYDMPGDPTKKKPMLVLDRTQQVLVEVEQEKTEKAGLMPTSPGEGDLAAGLNPHPPYLRWVDLYGEEICALGTHLKDDRQSGPATLRYDYEGNRKPVEVMKSHPMHGSGFVRESLRGTPPAPGSVGLHNLGNSCFLNSTVQCLNHIEPLTQFFLHDKYVEDLNKKNPLGSGGNVAVAYASLIKRMWGGQYAVLAPRMLKQAVANFAPQFDNSYQHDSQEFCQFLMDGLHEDLNRVQTKPYVEELEGFGMDDHLAAIESWRKHLLRHDSIIVDHCQGMHRSHLTCPQCGRESIKFDVFSSISLPLIPSKNRSTIELDDCLEKFMEGEQLDERNAWYCPSCRKHVCALKMIALWSVPDILILHLKRFTFDTCLTSGSMLRSKIDHKVQFPINRLDLTKHVLGPIDPEAPPVYNLFGVSEHTGPTANSGHYTATVRNSIDGQWYRCNDSHVGRTSGEASITGGAYLLFYRRAKGMSKWAGMHKVMMERNINPYNGLEKDQEGFTKVKSKKKKKS